MASSYTSIGAQAGGNPSEGTHGDMTKSKFLYRDKVSMTAFAMPEFGSPMPQALLFASLT